MIWLIAEDEADIRNLMDVVCRSWGYDTLVFEDGQKVWNWLDQVEANTYSESLPDFALLDIRMPGKRGDEVAARLRETSVVSDIPIVLMTAFALDEVQRQTILDNGVDQIIGKPLPDFDQLHILLHEVIQKKLHD
ncbi:MAG: response regulator [Anaerolineae bacterium]|nr:response regulator [Anaerolineae bacterium]